MLKVFFIPWEHNDLPLGFQEGFMCRSNSFPSFGSLLFLTNLGAPQADPENQSQADFLDGFVDYTAFILHPTEDDRFGEHRIYIVSQENFIRNLALMVHELAHFLVWFLPDPVCEWLNSAIDFTWGHKRLDVKTGGA